MIVVAVVMIVTVVIFVIVADVAVGSLKASKLASSSPEQPSLVVSKSLELFCGERVDWGGFQPLPSLGDPTEK